MVRVGGPLGRSLGNEGRALINGVKALMKETPELSSPFPPYEDEKSL